MKVSNKLLVIPYIHGTDIWKPIVADYVNTCDYVLFMGDYFDNDEVSPKEQVDNMLDILDFKEEYGEKVVLLLGNHDHQYNNGVRTNWFHPETNRIIQDYELFSKLQLCFQVDNYLFSHAGFTTSWLQKYICSDAFETINWANVSCSIEALNEIDSPIWLRPKELRNLLPYTQVIGHTCLKFPTTYIEHPYQAILMVENSSYDALLLQDDPFKPILIKS